MIAYYAARAGVAQAVDAIKTNSSWKDGFDKVPLEDNDKATYEVIFNKENPEQPAGKYDSTNNIDGSAPSRTDGINVPAGYAYIVSTGYCLNQIGAVIATRRVAVMVKGACSGTRFPYALAASSNITLKNTNIKGNIKANGNITVNADVDIAIYKGEGNMFSSADIINDSKQVTIETGEYVKARGNIENTSKINGTYVTGDTSSDTDPFIYDGSLTPGASGKYLPNPNTTELLVDAVTHTETEINDVFNLGSGGVHYFPNGVTFNKAFTGSGTIVVVGSGKTLKLNASIGSTSSYFPINLISLDGSNGIGTGGNIEVEKSAFINGLIYAHGAITTKAQFSVKGNTISYRGNITDAQIDIGAQADFFLAPFAVQVAGFGGWFDPVRIITWQNVY